MILALDVGNTQIYGGVFVKNELKFQFRKNTRNTNSSDEFGLFLRSVLRENGFDPKKVKHIAICSVVPDLVHSLRGACQKYFDLAPFMLQAGVKTGMRIKYRNPLEVGPDRIATAIAGAHLLPGRNLIIADFGTATTIDAVSKDKDYLGGMILPGIRISMEALETKTARLPAVEIVKPDFTLGRSTVESIQAGLYYSNLYALTGAVERIRQAEFKGEDSLVIGTGGFSRLFETAQIFDKLIPELVLLGLVRALEISVSSKEKVFQETNAAEI